MRRRDIYSSGCMLLVLVSVLIAAPVSSYAASHQGGSEQSVTVAQLRPQEAYLDRAYLELREGNFDQAIDDLNRVIESNSNNAEAYRIRGFAHLKKEDFGLAIGDYTRAIQIDPGYTESFDRRGFAHLRMGDYDLAVRDLSRAIELCPDYADAYYLRSMAYAAKNDYTRALSDLKKSMDHGYGPDPGFMQIVHRGAGMER